MSKILPQIDSAIHEKWEELLRTDARAASTFYFQNMLPAVIALHQHGLERETRFELLVSLMGLSPETTVLATALVHPQRLVIIASQNAGAYCEQCIDFLDKHRLLAREAVSVRFVSPTDHCMLYGALYEELGSVTGRRIVDLTGGKKVMSAVAGFAAWNLGLPVCYLESRAYNEQTRRPEPGSEELVILNSPARSPS